jgi:hypothetical protein
MASKKTGRNASSKKKTSQRADGGPGTKRYQGKAAGGPGTKKTAGGPGTMRVVGGPGTKKPHGTPGTKRSPGAPGTIRIPASIAGGPGCLVKIPARRVVRSIEVREEKEAGDIVLTLRFR